MMLGNTGGFVAAAGRLSARSYVQDGLTFQLDGIENAGYGVHDAASAVWKDLKGSDDLTVTSSGVWSDDGIDNFATGNQIAYRSSFTFAAPLTQEVVFQFQRNQRANQANGIILHIPQWHSGNSMLRGINSRVGAIKAFKLKSAGNDYGIRSSTNPVVIASVYDSSGVTTAYQNGDVVSFVVQYDDWYYNDATGVNLGNRSSNNRGTFVKFFAIRFYNRVLTETELEANYAVDRTRFNLSGGGGA